MPKYFQVNQPYANKHEFMKEYLCAPDQDVAHWAILKELQVDDILFHYSSTEKRVFGLSKVVALGPHKGVEGAQVVETSSTYRVYEGEHLSLKHMSAAAKAAESERVQRYIEVHTKIIYDKYLGLNFFEGRQVYCLRVDTALAEKRLGKGPKAEASQKTVVRKRPGS